ncbi:glycosyltransferase family 32 protein [Rosenbergiella metrosideri]|uniref:glycosyltransferase family 32 protein n=1 Tax=Rosenbergiella metrosideri TaxID=2921185 RepID=UPI001F4F9FA1|nr:glycosyltransferase [Rosenbergiella metrosideri]
MVPKIIHQCHTNGWLGLCDEELEAISINKERNPYWEHRFYSIEEMRIFVGKHYGKRIVNAFNSINPSYGAAIADYFRYLVMYQVGGVYLDVKSIALKPLDEIISHDDYFVVFGWQNNPRGFYEHYGKHDFIKSGFEYQQWNIVSGKKNGFLWDVILLVTDNIEKYSHTRDGVGWLGVLKTTGPIPYTNAILDSKSDSKFRFAGNNEANGFLYRNDEKYKKRVLISHYSSNSQPIILPSTCPP